MRNLFSFGLLALLCVFFYGGVNAPKWERETDARIEHQTREQEMGRLYVADPWKVKYWCGSVINNAVWPVEECMWKRKLAAYKRVKAKEPELIDSGAVQYPILGAQTDDWQKERVKECVDWIAHGELVRVPIFLRPEWTTELKKWNCRA